MLNPAFIVQRNLRDETVALLCNRSIQFLDTHVRDRKLGLNFARIVNRDGKLYTFDRCLDRIKGIPGQRALNGGRKGLSAGEKEDESSRDGDECRAEREPVPGAGEPCPCLLHRVRVSRRRIKHIDCFCAGNGRVIWQDAIVILYRRPNALVERNCLGALGAFRDVLCYGRDIGALGKRDQFFVGNEVCACLSHLLYRGARGAKKYIGVTIPDVWRDQARKITSTAAENGLADYVCRLG